MKRFFIRALAAGLLAMPMAVQFDGVAKAWTTYPLPCRVGDTQNGDHCVGDLVVAQTGLLNTCIKSGGTWSNSKTGWGCFLAVPAWQSIQGKLGTK